MYVANSAAKRELDDLHRGVGMALDELVRRKDYSRAENILREIDRRLVNLLNTLTIVERSN